MKKIVSIMLVAIMLFSFASCNQNTPEKALEWIDEKMIPHYPLGVYKDRSAKEVE